MSRAAGIGAYVLALVGAVAPAAVARTAEPQRPVVQCVTKQARPAVVARKPSVQCRRFSGIRAGSARSPSPMIAAGIATPGFVAPPIDPGAAAPAPGAPTAPAPAPAAATRLGVTAREWSLVLSRTILPAGAAIVELDNLGEDAHNLRIERVDGSGNAFDVPLAESGEVSSGRTTVAPGEYKLYCALPGHEAQGMRARLNVTGS
jgi:plastocyanin